MESADIQLPKEWSGFYPGVTLFQPDGKMFETRHWVRADHLR